MSRSPRRRLDHFALSNAGRKSRGRWTTVLTCWLMAEIVLAGALLIWSGSEAEERKTLLGPVASTVVVISTMSLLTLAVVVAAFARRLKRAVLLSTAVLTSVCAAWLAVVAIGAWITNAGVSTLLTFACVLSLPMILSVTRAESADRNARN